MDHERDYATLDKSVRSPIGPVVPGTYMSSREGSALVPELAAERNDASCHISVALPQLLTLMCLLKVQNNDNSHSCVPLRYN